MQMEDECKNKYIVHKTGMYLNCHVWGGGKKQSNEITNASDVTTCLLASLPVFTVPLLPPSGKTYCCSHMFTFSGSLNSWSIRSSDGYIDRSIMII